MPPADPMLSVVVPLKDEADNLEPLADRLRVVLDGVKTRWEVVPVDEGSTDGTYRLAVGLHEADARFKVLRLSRSFGRARHPPAVPLIRRRPRPSRAAPRPAPGR